MKSQQNYSKQPHLILAKHMHDFSSRHFTLSHTMQSSSSHLPLKQLLQEGQAKGVKTTAPASRNTEL